MFFVVLGFLVGCQSPTAPSVFTPPKKEQSVRPEIQNADTGVKKAVQKNQEISKQVDQQENTTAEQKVEISDAIAQVAAMRLKLEAEGEISKAEVDRLLTVLDKIRGRNAFLEKSFNDLKNNLNIQSEDLEKVELALKKANDLAIKKENEADTLRTQNTDYGDEVKKFKAIAKENEKLSKKAAANGVYKLWFFIALGVLVSYVVLTIIIKLYKPF